ncbi:hypothetical protein Tco_1149453, partial [Tanacetum coccineum]
YVGPFKVLEKVGEVAYKLELPEELSRVHNTFHVSNLKKCYTDEPLAIPLDGLHFDDKLQFVEEPVEIIDRKVKRLKRSRILIIKVGWNSRRGPEFTWEREDQFRKKYPHLFTKTAPSSSGDGGEVGGALFCGAYTRYPRWKLTLSRVEGRIMGDGGDGGEGGIYVKAFVAFWRERAAKAKKKEVNISEKVNSKNLRDSAGDDPVNMETVPDILGTVTYF